MLTQDDIISIEDEFSSDVAVRVSNDETKIEGTLTAIINVTPSKPGDSTMAVLILWDGNEEPEAIDLPSQAITLM